MTTVKEQEKKVCFVVSPIGADASDTRRKVDGLIDAVIEPIMKGMGFEVLVAHRLPNPGSITAQVIQAVLSSDLVIANLTGLNANVMYELAIRHSFSKPAVVIAEKGTTLPFDINDQRTVFYSDDFKGAVELADNLRKFVPSAMQEKVDNPVISVAHQAAVLAKTTDDSQKYIVETLSLLTSNLSMLANKVESMPKLQVFPAGLTGGIGVFGQDAGSSARSIFEANKESGSLVSDLKRGFISDGGYLTGKKNKPA